MFLDLGFTPPADQFRRKEQLKDEDIYYPLQACACEDCGLVQLNHVVSHEILYRNDYPYESSTTKMGRVSGISHKHPYKIVPNAKLCGIFTLERIFVLVIWNVNI